LNHAKSSITAGGIKKSLEYNVPAYLCLIDTTKAFDTAQIQSDQKENKAEQALQMMGHLVAQFYANKRTMHGRRQFVVSNATLK
jgi:hypothetical protein